MASLAAHLGNPETTIIAGELYIVRDRPANARGVRYPDLYIAFDVDPDLHFRQNGYVIADQGKAAGLRDGDSLHLHPAQR